jgi:CubicO group peptidase (beta-lactamase class C family)
VTNATKKLNALFDTFGQRADVSELKVELFRTSDSLSYKYAAVDSKPTHFIASSTKLMASALIDILEARGLISKKGPIGEYVDAETKALVSGLKDESPDYRTPRALMKVKDVESFTANSLGLDFAAMLQIAKERGVGDAGRAFQYSGVNYQILGKMVEHVTGLSVEAALKEHIFRPLQMTQTKLFKLSDLQEFHDHSQLLVRDQRHLGPRRLAGSDLEGGVTSTTSDTLKFMRGYFECSLVTEENRQSAVANPRPMLPGISMGAGIMRLKFPKTLTGFRDTPEFFGHIGMTSHLMFYSPEEQLHIIFTANQIGKPGINVAPLPKLLKILLG